MFAVYALDDRIHDGLDKSFFLIYMYLCNDKHNDNWEDYNKCIII